MIAIPIDYDQPAVAARLAWLKVAEVLPVKGLSAKELRLALAKLLNNAGYRNAAVEIQAKIRSARGLDRAVEVIEEALEKYAISHGASSKEVGQEMNGARQREPGAEIVHSVNIVAACQGDTRMTVE